MDFKEENNIMNIIKQIKLSDIKNKNIIRIGLDVVENKKYYQYRFKLNNETYMYFKYYLNNSVSQIFINDQEYLAFYKTNILSEILKNINKKIDTKNFIII